MLDICTFRFSDFGFAVLQFVRVGSWDCLNLGFRVLGIFEYARVGSWDFVYLEFCEFWDS